MASRRFLVPANLLNLVADPASGESGDLYFNTVSDKIRIFDGTSWIDVGGSGSAITVSTTAPPSPQEGDAWFDVDSGILYVYDGSFWIEATAASSIFVGEVAPSNPEVGFAWFENTTGKLYIYDGTFWVQVVSIVETTMTQEQIQDNIAPLFTHSSHTNITASYDDANNKIILAAGAGYTNEEAVDAVAGAIASGTHSNVSISYDDANNRISFSSTDTNTTYSVSAETATGGTNLRLTDSSAGTDDVKLASGTNMSVIRTDANTITFNSTGDYTSVDSITYPDYITFDTTPETIPTAPGSLFWDDGDGLPKAILNANVELGIGQEQVALVKNATGSTIAKGKVVYINGAQGQRPTIALSDADTEATSSKTFGLTAEAIADGAEGFVTTFGVLRGVNTDGLTEGAALWLSSTAGGYTTTIPAEPAHSVFIGYVVKAHASSGEIFVNIQNGYELNELHGVTIEQSLADNEVLSYDTSSGLWKNQTAAEAGLATIADLTLENVTDGGATSSNAITISNATQSTTPTSGALIVSGGVGISKDVWIDGDLHVNGTTITQNTQTVSTHDNLIYLNAAQDSVITNAVGSGTYVTYTAENSYSPGMDIRVTGMNPAGYNISDADGLTVYSATSTQFVVAKTTTSTFVSGGTAHAKTETNPDLGFAGGYYNAGYAHAGLFRDASDGVFKFFQGYTPEPDEAVNIDTTHSSFALADISANNIQLDGAINFDVIGGTPTGSISINNGPGYDQLRINASDWLSLIATNNVSLTSVNTLVSLNAGDKVVISGTNGEFLNNHTVADNQIATIGNLSSYAPLASPTFTGTVTIPTLNLTNALGYAYGGTGMSSIGGANNVLTVNSAGTALQYTNSLTINSITTGEAITKTTSTALTSSTVTTIGTFPVPSGNCIAVECVVLISSTSNGSYYASKVLITADPDFNAVADITEYAIMKNNDFDLFPIFTATLNGSNVLLRVSATGASNATAKVISTSILSPQGAA